MWLNQLKKSHAEQQSIGEQRISSASLLLCVRHFRIFISVGDR